MRILGVDPGSRATGWAVVSLDPALALVAAGVLRPEASAPLVVRLAALHAGLLAVVDREAPELAAVERVFAGVNPQSLITLGEARGALLLALVTRGLPVEEITPAEVKRAVTGTGAAEKEQVRRMVAALLPSRPASPRRLALDAADAAAVALACAFRRAGRGARLAASALRPLAARAAAPEAPSGAWKRRPSG